MAALEVCTHAAPGQAVHLPPPPLHLPRRCSTMRPPFFRRPASLGRRRPHRCVGGGGGGGGVSTGVVPALHCWRRCLAGPGGAPKLPAPPSPSTHPFRPKKPTWPLLVIILTRAAAKEKKKAAKAMQAVPDSHSALCHTSTRNRGRTVWRTTNHRGSHCCALAEQAAGQNWRPGAAAAGPPPSRAPYQRVLGGCCCCTAGPTRRCFLRLQRLQERRPLLRCSVLLSMAALGVYQLLWSFFNRFDAHRICLAR